MSTFKKLKIPMALLLTSGVVATAMSVDMASPAQADHHLQSKQQEKDDVVGKADYLPDVLGRIGYAIFMAKQQLLDNIRNFTLPGVDLVYADQLDEAVFKLDQQSALPSVETYEEPDYGPIVSDIDHPEWERDPRSIHVPVEFGVNPNIRMDYGLYPRLKNQVDLKLNYQSKRLTLLRWRNLMCLKPRNQPKHPRFLNYQQKNLQLKFLQFLNYQPKHLLFLNYQ